jgi:hypothetical protein
MHLDVEIIHGLFAEQQVSTDQLEYTCIWPHPWEHYPFLVDGKRKWLRYIDLEVEQKKLISNTISEIENDPCLAISAGINAADN